nr:hypothetical protein [Tanacetum cinerariifolium]
MCTESWGHGSFAHALIELEATVGLKDKLVVVILKLEGSKCTMETIYVEYEWKHPRCDECNIVHLCDNCPKKPSTSNTPPKARKQKDQDEFSECETEESKGGNWDNQVKHQGIRFTKSSSGSCRSVVKPNVITLVSNVFFDLQEDNRKPMDDLVADTRKNVKALSKKTSIWSGRKADSPKT